jgi:DNA polymerase V
MTRAAAPPDSRSPPPAPTDGGIGAGATGFPSPADDHLDGRLDLHALLVRRPAATFFARARGPSMRDAGIGDGDLLVVDRSIPPQSGDIVVATLDGGLVVRRLARRGTGWALVSATPDTPPLGIDGDEGVTVWGVVTYCISRHCRR